MDKDRDISRPVTSITPKKVGIVGTAVLAGSAFVAACGGGSSRSATTPEGGVGGAQSNPTSGQTIEIRTAVSSPTAKVEAPTVAPTATVEAKLTQEQMLQIAGNVKQLITSGLSETPVTAEQISGNPIASNSYLDPDFVSQTVALCDLNNYGKPFSLLGGRTVQPGDFDYASEFLGKCAQPAAASKVLYKASGNEKFKQASEAWKPLHKQIFDEVRKKDPKISENAWRTTLNLYYTLQ